MSSSPSTAQLTMTKGARVPRAPGVDGAREDLLARPALAEQEHHGLALGRAAGALDRSLDGGALADDRLDLRVEFLLGEPLRPLQFLALERFLDHQLEVTGRQGLGEKVPGAFLHRLDRLLHRRVGSHDDDRGLWRYLPGMSEHLEATHPREPQIQEHDGRSLGGELLDRPGAAGDGRHRISKQIQTIAQQEEDVQIVVDHQDPGSGLVHGRGAYGAQPNESRRTIF